jgi:N-acetylglucosaminyl-diphospho-decaprenol L-rhamnosyltransferase
MTARKGSTETHPVISIIIVNWNTKDHLYRCIQSIPDATGDFLYEIIVVDNASADGSAAMVREKFPRIRVVESNKNLGFGRGNQLGLTHTRGAFVAAVNPDVVLNHRVLEYLVKFLQQHPKAGMVGPRIVNPDGKTESGAESLPDLLSAITFYPVFGKLYRSRWERQRLKNTVVKCDWVRGPCMVFRRSALEIVRGFPTKTFMYGEEMLLGHAMKRSTFEVWYLPDYSVVHNTSAGAMQIWNKTERTARIRKARILVMKELFSFPSFLLWNNANLLGLIIQGLIFCLKPKCYEQKLNRILLKIHLGALLETLGFTRTCLKKI